MLFCCKGCLRGDGDTKELYTVLGLDSKRVSVDEIKKAYKKKSLSLHPDKLKQRGIEVTDESAKEFLRVKEAYEILSDKKRRDIYDQIGLNGLKLLENPTEVDPVVFISNFQKNRKDRAVLIFVLLIVFALIFFLPVLFSLKCDGSLSGLPWYAVWIPMWIIDAVLLIVALTLFTMDTAEPDDKNSDKDTDKLSGNRDNTAEDEDEDEGQKVVVSLYEKWMNFLSTVLFVAIQVLVLAEMDHAINLSWFAVFVPWYLYEAMGFVALIQSAWTPITPPNHDDSSLLPDPEDAMQDDMNEAHFGLEMKYFDEVQNQHADKKGAVVALLRVWFALFLAMQLDTGYSESFNWGMVFLPIWVYLAMELCVAYYWKLEGDKMLEDLDPESLTEELLDWKTMAKVKQAQQLAANCQITYIMVTVFPLLMAILAVCKLQGSSYSTFVVILPIMVVLSCLCMCVFGAFFCLANVDPEKMDEEIKAKHQQRHGGGGGEGQGQDYGATGSSGTSPAQAEVSSETIALPQNYSPPPEPVAPPTPKPAPVKAEDVSLDMID